MIENDVELHVTLRWIDTFQGSVDTAARVGPPEVVDPVIWDAHVAGMASQLATMEREVREYRLRSAQAWE
ncbi:hypothetical protein G6L37_07260 [Agrobacterium rubi]|nr:hypothetical protein [Agrobacterium rubi]NTF25165.1 hypothetical protein [Agrobacterium rubi]